MSDYFSDCSVATEGLPAPLSPSLVLPKPLAQEGDVQALQKEPWDPGTNLVLPLSCCLSQTGHLNQFPHLLNGVNAGTLAHEIVSRIHRGENCRGQDYQGLTKTSNKQASWRGGV